MRNDGGRGYLLVTFCGDGSVLVVDAEGDARLLRENEVLDESRFAAMAHFTQVGRASPG